MVFHLGNFIVIFSSGHVALGKCPHGQYAPEK